MTQNSRLQINLGGLKGNIAAWRRLLRGAGDGAGAAGRGDAAGDGGGAKLCAVVKADAYSLGAEAIARAAAEAGADMLAVYSLDEAETLLDSPASAPLPVLVLMPTTGQAAPCQRLGRALKQGRLHLSVDDTAPLAPIQRLGRDAGRAVPIHLHVDTGMSRGGLAVESLAALAARVARSPHLRLAGVFTHFAAADTDPIFTDEQLTRFRAAVDNAAIQPPFLRHAASTSAAARAGRYHLDMVRLGLGMYGFQPGPPIATVADDFQDRDTPAIVWPTDELAFDCGDEEPAPAMLRLQPVVRWLSRIIHVARYRAGATVGYGCTHRLKRDSLLGIVPVGYSDGYPLALSGKAVVGLIGPACGAAVNAPVLGRVNMDQMVVDLTDALGAAVGTTVELISDDPASPCALPRLAELAGTTCYELLCRLSPRLPRCYVDTISASMPPSSMPPAALPSTRRRSAAARQPQPTAASSTSSAA